MKEGYEFRESECNSCMSSFIAQDQGSSNPEATQQQNTY